MPPTHAYWADKTIKEREDQQRLEDIQNSLDFSSCSNDTLRHLKRLNIELVSS